MIKLDLHIHTEYSGDSLISLDKLIKKCKDKNIIPAITDHNSVKAIKYIKKNFPKFKFIPGIEISSKDGHIIGLFCNKLIKKDLSAQETIDLIHKQGGLVVAAHPFSKHRNGLEDTELIRKCDIIEVFNARNFKKENEEAEEFANKSGMIKSAGSDAHFLFEIGNTHIEMEEFDFENPKDFLKKLKKAKFYKKHSPIYVHGTTTLAKYYKKLRGWKNE